MVVVMSSIVWLCYCCHSAGGDLGWVKGCCNVIYCVAVLLLSFVTLPVTWMAILVGGRVVEMSSIVWLCYYYHLSFCA